MSRRPRRNHTPVFKACLKIDRKSFNASEMNLAEFMSALAGRCQVQINRDAQ